MPCSFLTAKSYFFLFAMTALLLITGCGSGRTNEAKSGETSNRRNFTDGIGRAVSIAPNPGRIISLAPNLT